MDIQVAFLFISLGLSLVISRELFGSISGYLVEIAKGLRAFRYHVQDQPQFDAKVMELAKKSRLTISEIEVPTEIFTRIRNEQEIVGKKTKKTIHCNAAIFVFLAIFPMAEFLANLSTVSSSNSVSAASNVVKIPKNETIWYAALSLVYIYAGYYGLKIYYKLLRSPADHFEFALNNSRYPLVISQIVSFFVVFFVVEACFGRNVHLSFLICVIFVFISTALYRIPMVNKANGYEVDPRDLTTTTYHNDIKPEYVAYITCCVLVLLAELNLKAVYVGSSWYAWVNQNYTDLVALILAVPLVKIILAIYFAVSFTGFLRFLSNFPALEVN